MREQTRMGQGIGRFRLRAACAGRCTQRMPQQAAASLPGVAVHARRESAFGEAVPVTAVESAEELLGGDCPCRARRSNRPCGRSWPRRAAPLVRSGVESYVVVRLKPGMTPRPASTAPPP